MKQGDLLCVDGYKYYRIIAVADIYFKALPLFNEPRLAAMGNYMVFPFHTSIKPSNHEVFEKSKYTEFIEKILML